jgi:hypothetical protein
MNLRVICKQKKVVAVTLCGLIALVAVGCNDKLHRIGKGADDVDQYSQKIQEEAKPKK